MNRSAVFHRTYSEYSFATAPDRVVIRLRAARGDLDACHICYGDRMDPNSPIAVTREQMAVRFTDSLFDYYEAIFDPKVTRLCYYFELKKGGETTFYYNDGFFSAPDENRQLYYNFHYIRIEDMAHVPDWFKSAVVYQIYPDSFASSQGYIAGQEKHVVYDGKVFSSRHGGTLRGICNNLPYLNELGIDCIYMTPIFAANSWHKYDTVDYFEIDPCFGTKEDFRMLVDACHKKGIRVILDGVFNHCGPDFFAFQDLRENGAASPYKDWFYVQEFPPKGGPRPNYECFAYVDSMPKLNTGNPETARYLLEVGTYWVQEFDIDGWRLDVANEVDHDFWRQFRKAIRAIKADAVLIGEIWDDARSFLEGDQFDSAMNYNLMFAIVDAIANGRLTALQFAQRISYLLMRYQEPIQAAQMNLIDSHDIPRFLSQAGGSRDKLKQAVLFLLTHTGVPMVFYGDEQGLSGWHESEYRRPMDWSDPASDLFAFYQKAIRLRRNYTAAIRSGYRILSADEDVLTYCCVHHSEGFLVVMNLSDRHQYRSILVPQALNRVLQSPVDYFTSERYSTEGSMLMLELAPNSAVLVPTL